MNKEVQCKTHPDAPHGFVRNASHTEDRYVCECEYWEEPKVNERIYTLAREAGLIAPYGSDREGLRDFDYRMFAQLIVRECALTAGLMEHEGRRGIGAQILDNFGVEE